MKTTREKGIIIASVFALLLIAFVVYNTIQSNFFTKNDTSTGMGVKRSSLSLTSFDRDLGRRTMDKDNDGKCDSCGMPVDMCLDTGQLECNMDSKSTMGVLGSSHIHADWKVYINGNVLDLSDKAHMDRMKKNLPVSSFMHVDSGSPLPEKTGDVLHMHAKNLPLWLFFESVGMYFTKECLTVESGEKFCTDEGNTLKFYVNGQPNNQYEQYIFKEGDKILISYGDKEEDITQQLKAITNFAQVHIDEKA